MIYGVGPHGRVKSRVKELPVDTPDGERYGMEADPSETKNLWAERQDVVKERIALLEKYQKEGRIAPADSWCGVHAVLQKSVSPRNGCAVR